MHITNAYAECSDGLMALTNGMGRGYSYEIARAKVLYAKHARKVGSGIATRSGNQQAIEYGPHIPSLAKSAKSGELG